MKKSIFTIENILLTLWFAMTAWFYLWTASTNDTAFKFDFGEKQDWYNAKGYQERSYAYYNYLADAFMEGQMHLLILPGEKLLSKENPYDPKQHAYISLLDASLYNNKYYFYFGPAPAVTFFIPYRIFFSGKLPSNLAAVIMSYGGFIFAFLLLKFFRRRYFNNIPFWMFFLSVMALSLCTFIPYVLRRPSAYEIAITGAYFFSTGGFYFLLSGILGNELKNRELILGSIFLGLAFGSRAVLFWAFPALIFIFIIILKKYKDNKFGKALPQLLMLALPYSIIIFLLGLYNYLRFGNWFEFGQKWMLTLQDMTSISHFKVENFFPNLTAYLFKPIQIISDFPYFTIGFEHTYENGFSMEPVAGLIFTVPAVLLVLIFFFNIKKIKRERPHFFLSMLSIMAAGVLILLFVSFYSAITMRYAVDFTALLLITGLISWFYLYKDVNDEKSELEKIKFREKKAAKKIKKRTKAKLQLSVREKAFVRKKTMLAVISFFAAAAILYGCAANIFLSFAGCHNNLKIGNPALYKSIEEIF